MTAPTTVWVNIATDSKGRPRGFEKSTERFHLIEDDATRERQGLDFAEHSQTVECVIMSKAEYDALVGATGQAPTVQT